MELGLDGRAPVQGSDHRKREIYSHSLDRTLTVRDVRADVARASRRRPNETAELRAFLESKRRLIRSHPHLTSAERARALAKIDRIEAKLEDGAAEAVSDGDSGGGDSGDDEPPLPGGVGFGVFYRPLYQIDFEAGTAAEYTILCPTTPGGSIHSWLYLAATNRAARCPEAVVAYHGLEECRFAVFDWAREDRWQTDLPYPRLGDYLRPLVLNEGIRQALHVLTFTEESSDRRWRNEVYLRNIRLGTLDLIYAYEYESSLEAQQHDWEGSWGPIIETFQNRYRGTEELGFADFSVATRRGAEWGPWERLSPADTYVAQDDAGFRMVYLEPNHTFLAAA